MNLKLDIERQIQSDQTSFIGGKPRLPKNEIIPHCKLCGAEQTFFFQMAFTDSMLWNGNSMAIFACTSCQSDDYLIPKMLSSVLKDADIPEGFLSEYQKNFAIIIFPTEDGEIVESYQERIKFGSITKSPGGELGSFGFIGQKPIWVMSDETPATYAGKANMGFLFQISEEYEFLIHGGVKGQIECDFFAENKLQESQDGFYTLFLGNSLYFFGTEDGPKLTYILTQTD